MISNAEALQKIGARTLRDDSRLVEKGDVFVWDSRQQRHAEPMIADAVARGAGLIVSDLKLEGVIQIEEPGELLAHWAAKTWPGQPEVMLGVTGTSGKTSVAWFGRQLAGLCGKKAASVGTLGVMRKDTDVETEYTGFTSPTALKLHPILSTLAREGVTHCTFEVSSHALDMRRADGVTFAAAGLINITQDHIDYHKTLEAYAAAKLRLFAEVLPEGAGAVVNVGRRENIMAAAVAKQRGLRLLTVGLGNAELVVEVVKASGAGLEVNLKYDAVPVPVMLPLVGSFQAENLSVALGLLVVSGMEWKTLAAKVAKVTGVPGRMEMVAPGVVVDYAHKPDALQRALESLRPLVKGKGRLIVVFGCGGNRDALKRPMMGRIAAELADVVIVTDDNPRKEAADDIRKQVMAGVKEGGKAGKDIGDRKKAIAAALEEMKDGDVVLVAGKGHEQGQIVGTEVLPFDDREVVKELLG